MVLKAKDVKQDSMIMGTAVEVTCDFCKGIYVVFDRTPTPFTQEELDMMWFHLVPPKAKPHPWSGRNKKGKKKKN